MRASTRKKLTIWWAVTLATMAWPFAFSRWVNLGGVVALAWICGFVLFVITIRRVERGAHLQRPGWYRAALGLQLLLVAAGMVTSARTVFAHDSPGLIFLSSADLIGCVITYRALVRPSPKLAMWSTLCAAGVAFYALMADIFLDLHYMHLGHPSALRHDLLDTFALLSAFIQPVVAGLVAIATINAFGDRTNLPDAVASMHPDHHDHVD